MSAGEGELSLGFTLILIYICYYGIIFLIMSELHRNGDFLNENAEAIAAFAEHRFFRD